MLSAKEVDAMDERQYKWFVFDMLQKGNKKMDEAKNERLHFVEEIKKVRQDHCNLVDTVEKHCSNARIHTPIKTQPQPVKEWLLDWRVIISLSASVAIIVAALIEKFW